MQRAITDTLFLRTVENDHDVQRLAAFNSIVHADSDQPDPRIGVWVADMLTPGKHPTLTPDDYFLVEDTSNGEVVSSLCVIPQTWTYRGVPFGVGRIELVGTHQDYRRRGLVREQFVAAHARCEELGSPVQGITGLPYYYRQFGYEYALELDGGLIVPFESFPAMPADSPFSLREWQPADLPCLEALYAGFARGKLVVCQRPTDHWLYRYATTGEQSIGKQWLYVITRSTEIIGYLTVPLDTWGPRARITELVLSGSYAEVVPWLLPRLREEMALRFAAVTPPLLQQLNLFLGNRHPIYPYLKRYQAVLRPAYAWYIRVPDLAAFIRHIAPALDRRIAASPLAGLTRSLTLDFYTGGLRLDFEAGRLAVAENLARGVEKSDAAFPPLVFLQILFGYRSLTQIRRWFPDAYCEPGIDPILNGLFPREPSWVMYLS